MASARNLSISTRLGGGFGFVMLGTVIVFVVALLALTEVKRQYDNLADNYLKKVLQIEEMQANTNIVARSIRTIALFKDPAVQASEREAIAKARHGNKEILAELEKEITSPKGKELLKDAEEHRNKFNATLEKTLSLLDSGEGAEARDNLLHQMRPAQFEYMKSVEALSAFQKDLMKVADKEVDATVDNGKLLMIGFGVASILLGVFIAWWVSRSVTQPIGTAMKLAETIASGDLTSRVEVTSTDETGRLLESMRKMNESLQRIVGEVRLAADTIATGSTQIASGTQDLSSRTEEQASNLQETAASMEQLTATVKQSAESAAQANQLATSASASAANGGAVVQKVVQTMEQITAQSHKIADIITVIDGIAFQTNILALNASVEAARAGEQGRGFAVVAGEVRNLAQRAAQAAKEIKTLINASVEQIESGGVLVHEAGRTMAEIVGQVKQVSDLIGEITAASREEGTGIMQINDAVTQLDQVTQQNAALVEESAAAADSLKSEAQHLAQTVAVFRTQGGESAFTAHSEAPPPVAPAPAKPAAKAPARPAAARPVAPRKPAAKAPEARPAKAPAGAPDEKSWEEF